MAILVTGASGFVGSHLCKALKKAGYSVIAYDKTVKGCVACDASIPGDLTQPDSLLNVPWESISVVFHLAAAGVKASQRNWKDCLSVNVQGTQNLIWAMQSTHTSARLVFTRSFYENHISTCPSFRTNPYVATKYMASQLVKQQHGVIPGGVTLATLFQAYGSGDDASNVVNYLLNRLDRGDVAQMGSGKGKRDWIYIDDVVSGLIACIDAPSGFYDLGVGNVFSLHTIATRIAEILGKPTSLLDFDSARDRGDIEIEDAAMHPPPGWEAAYSLECGLKTLIRHTREGDQNV